MLALLWSFLVLMGGKADGQASAHFQFSHSDSFKFIHFVSSDTMLALLWWSFLVLMRGKADGQDFFLTKTIGFDFLLFNYMLLIA